MPILWPSRVPRAAVPALILATLAACFSDAVEPARELLVVLESPNGGEGAAVIELVGPGIGPVAAPAGRLFSYVSGDTTRVVILLDAPGSIEFTVQVQGRAYPGAAVLQVADERNNLRTLAGYRARVAPAEGPPR